MQANGFEAAVTLDFAQKEVFGQGLCSNYFGKYPYQISLNLMDLNKYLIIRKLIAENL
jgi:hypothetical protein